MHFVGMAAIQISPSTTIPIPPKMMEPAILGYFVAAMAMLLVGTGIATTMIARGARKEAQTQLRNIADASVEGLILTDGTAILDFNESARSLVGPQHAAKLRNTAIWEILDYSGDRTSTASRRRCCRTKARSPSRSSSAIRIRTARCAASMRSATCASAAPPSSASSISPISTR